MDLKVGLTDTPGTLDLELDSDTDAGKLKSEIDGAIESGQGTVWITDKEGNEVGLAASKIAFVRLGTGDSARKIGFGV